MIFFASGLTLFIGWLFWVPTTDTFKLKNLELGKKLQVATVAQDQQSELDSDHDGLKDWEEALWHTDPHNPDTDGDGTPDGEEVRLGRNPLIPGPNDYLSTTTPQQPASSTDLATSGNLTESVSTKLMAELIRVKSSGGSVENLPQQLLTKSAPPPFQDEFSFGDIALSNDNSKSAAKNYINAVGAIAGRELKQTHDVGAIILSADNKQDYSLLDQLSADAAAYGKISEEIKKIKTPSSLSFTHLEMINAANNARKAIVEIQQMGSDPLIAIHGWNEFMGANQHLKNIARAVATALNDKKIVLTPSDHGYIFKQFYNQSQ